MIAHHNRGSSFTCARHLMVITWWAYFFDLESSIHFQFLIFSFFFNLLHFLLHFFHYFEGSRNNTAYCLKGDGLPLTTPTSQIMSLSPTTSRRLMSIPKQRPWPTHSSPSKGSSRTWSTMTPRSKRCFENAHREHDYHSQREGLSLGQSSSSVSERTGRSVGWRVNKATF